jgi:hypothetical protein
VWKLSIFRSPERLSDNRTMGYGSVTGSKARMRFGSRAKLVETETPSTSLRAGSSLRLKNGYAQDDQVV